MILRMHSAEAIADASIAKSVERELLHLQHTDQAWGLTEGLMRHEVGLQVVAFEGYRAHNHLPDSLRTLSFASLELKMPKSRYRAIGARSQTKS
jgi:hypothetical protein